jgi:hypothetical protein
MERDRRKASPNERSPARSKEEEDPTDNDINRASVLSPISSIGDFFYVLSPTSLNG